MTEPEITVDFAAVEELASLTGEAAEEKHQADPMGSGFLWYTPPLAFESSPLSAGGQQWIVSGNDMQVLSMTIPPGKSMIFKLIGHQRSCFASCSFCTVNSKITGLFCANLGLQEKGWCHKWGASCLVHRVSIQMLSLRYVKEVRVGIEFVEEKAALN